MTDSTRAAVAVRYALAAVLSLASFVFIFGMPWNDLGLWRQTEVPSALLHFSAALVAFLVGFLAFKRDEETLGLLRHPAVIAIACLALATAALAPLTDSPWRSIHGTLKHGIGVLWHLELAVLIVGCALVLRSKASPILESALAISTASVLLLYLLPDNSVLGHPMSFAEWTGMFAAASAFVIVSKAKSVFSLRAFVSAGLLVTGIAVSENRAVMLAVATCVVVLLAMKLPITKGWLSTPRLRASFIVVAGLLGIAAMSAVAPLVERVYAGLEPIPGSQQVLSDNPLDRHALQNGVFGTLWSRSHMILMVFRDVAENPSSLLTGQGWGAFATVYENHAREVPGRLFPTSLPTASLTYWDAQKMSDFHSHNLPVEALLSGGIVALALWFAALAGIATASRRGLLAATGIMVGALFWFPVNHMTVAIAALIAVSLSPVSLSNNASRIWPTAAAATLALVSSILFIAGSQILALARVEHNERYFTPVQADRNTASCSAISTIMLPEDEVNMSLYEVLSQRILASSDRGKAIVDRTSNLTNLSCTMRRYFETTDNIRALVTSLEKRAMLISIGPESYAPLVDDIVNWGKDVDRLLDLAPQRTEHVVPYLSALAKRSKNRDLVAAEFDRLIARLPADDPVTVYVTAMRALNSGDQARFKQLMQKAVSLGYANIYPVPMTQVREFKLQ